MRRLALALALGGLGGITTFFLLRADSPSTVVSAAPRILPSIAGEYFELDASEIVRRGAATVYVVRLEGRGELVPHHFRDSSFEEPVPIEEWQARLGAPLVFNAGQFDEELEHLGLLRRDGRWLSEQARPQWRGLLLSGPTHDGAWARVADLDQAPEDVVTRYRHALQSMMLVDDAGRVRTRDTERAACRTVVAEDVGGRVLVLVTVGAVTLGDLARWLVRQPLGIVRAMNLDGGIESQLALDSDGTELLHYGQLGTGTTVFEGGPGLVRYPLPAVVAWRPLRGSP